MKFKIKRKSLTKYLWLTPVLICVGVLAYNGFVMFSWMRDKRNIEFEIAEVAKVADVEEAPGGEPVNPPNDRDNDYWNFMKLPLINVDIKALKQQNPDTVGFISVAGTNINYPVVQTNNNDFYLNNSFRKQRNHAGWIFMDHRNNPSLIDQNTVIYGHARVDDTMFSTLKNILNTSWIDVRDNHVVRYVTETETMLFQVFSVYTVPVESYYIQTRFGDKQYVDWLSTMQGRSKYDFRAPVNENDRILTLSTCYNNNDSRVVMQAKLIKKDSL
jgi:sortase B